MSQPAIQPEERAAGHPQSHEAELTLAPRDRRRSRVLNEQSI
jgi:hypothetical protein